MIYRAATVLPTVKIAIICLPIGVESGLKLLLENLNIEQFRP